MKPPQTNKQIGSAQDAYTDYRVLLDRQDIDAVDVCVHPGPHLEITRAAAAAGKHILMEKPMCCNVAEGDEMVAAAEKCRCLSDGRLHDAVRSGIHETEVAIRRWHTRHTADGVF